MTYKDLEESIIEQLNDNVYVWDLSDIDLRCLYNINIMIDNNYSLRQCSKECLLSKSQIHRDIHERLPGLSIEMYDRVKHQLKKRQWGY